MIGRGDMNESAFMLYPLVPRSEGKIAALVRSSMSGTAGGAFADRVGAVSPAGGCSLIVLENLA